MFYLANHLKTVKSFETSGNELKKCRVHSSLCSLQSANNVFLSHQISISHQLPASQQYFCLTTNQHQPPATISRTEYVSSFPTWILLRLKSAVLDGPAIAFCNGKKSSVPCMFGFESISLAIAMYLSQSSLRTVAV